jgi:hypothetical protein
MLLVVFTAHLNTLVCSVDLAQTRRSSKIAVQARQGEGRLWTWLRKELHAILSNHVAYSIYYEFFLIDPSMSALLDNWNDFKACSLTLNALKALPIIVTL